MSVSDSRFDSSYNYMWYQDNGQWSIRFTAWYLPGLLHRGKPADIETAIAAIENMYVAFFLQSLLLLSLAIVLTCVPAAA